MLCHCAHPHTLLDRLPIFFPFYYSSRAPARPLRVHSHAHSRTRAPRIMRARVARVVIF